MKEGNGVPFNPSSSSNPNVNMAMMHPFSQQQNKDEHDKIGDDPNKRVKIAPNVGVPVQHGFPTNMNLPRFVPQTLIAPNQNTTIVQAPLPTSNIVQPNPIYANPLAGHQGNHDFLNQMLMMSMKHSPNSIPPQQSILVQNVHRAPTSTNIHLASLLAGSNGDSVPRTRIPPPHLNTLPTSKPTTKEYTDVKCHVCDKSGVLYECSGACGLKAHISCIGEENIYASMWGHLCGSCIVIQQNRTSKEDVSKNGVNALSIRRAIVYLNMETNSGMNFNQFGHLTPLRLLEIGSIVGYPIKPFAEQFVEPFLQRWTQEKLRIVPNVKSLSISEIFMIMIGMYSLKKAGISHHLGASVLQVIKNQNYSVMDFLGWHPSIEGPSVRSSNLCGLCGIRNQAQLENCAKCGQKLSFPSVFTKLMSAFLATFYAEQVGVRIGTILVDVFSHLNTVRQNYRGLKPFDKEGHEWNVFSEQMRMIFVVLDIVSDFGILQLHSNFFEPELKYVFNPVYINQAMVVGDFELVGKFLQSMRLFGQLKSTQNIALISSLERFLICKQDHNGSWCKVDGNLVDRYKATIICAKALLYPSFRGFGPANPSFHKLLEKWSKITGPLSRRAKALNDAKFLGCGATIRHSSMEGFKRLEKYYKRQILSKGRNVLEALVITRLRTILPLRKRTRDVIGRSLSSKEQVGSNEGNEADVENEVELENEDDEDVLTSMSLTGELSIFDGLKFEDGDIIDLSHTESMTTGTDEQESGADGSADPGPEEDEGDAQEMYDDDDDDESGDTSKEEETSSEGPTILQSDLVLDG